ncbi:MAG: type III pantothenate kinase [Clostridiales bacterium]|nr:type III pantothenate kinase [Clostridiales bacterium]
MVFTVDVGNTNIVLGAFDEDDLAFVSRISTDPSKMADQYAIDFADILTLYGYSPRLFDGAIISSVVPPLTPIIKEAVEKLLSCKVYVVSPGIKTGLNIKIDDPAMLGSDLVCAAVSALDKYELPCIIFDLGTSTTTSAIDKDGLFLGGSIYPGVQISLDALSSRTAQLPFISMETVDKVIGTNTIDSMKSGIILGTASLLDGMVLRYSEVLGGEPTVIATGGLASMIIPHCRCDIIVDNNLMIDGLYRIYKNNAL